MLQLQKNTIHNYSVKYLSTERQNSNSIILKIVVLEQFSHYSCKELKWPTCDIFREVLVTLLEIIKQILFGFGFGFGFYLRDFTVTACSEQGSFAKPHWPAAASPNPYTSNMPTD